MDDEHVPTREAVHLEPVSDPLIAFFWARLDEAEDDAKSSGPGIEVYDGGEWRRQADMTLADVRAKKAILDDYARRCADLDNPAREMECQLIRDVIKRLATVYAGHSDYTEDFRP
ncbi:DUF6221 family protein [Amycolatopsis sp. NPDC049159]|uniref:DUF6221 family protein n=1 Tax=Amycolatopsis sp. NPDC049159 TaxID=3157210 RepID=UPI0033F790F3